MLLVDKQSSYSARSGVDIFIITPGGEIYVPVVEMNLDITDSMGKVPTYEKTLRMRMCGDCLDIEVLAGVVLYTWKENECSGRRVLIDGSENVGGSYGCH